MGSTPSERDYLSIKEVLDVLVEEFSDITISKIRFLESRGLIHPERTPSGYRKFFEGDVDRLRWILRQQREHFLPLKVIKGRLDREQGGASEPSLFDADLDTDDTVTTPPVPSLRTPPRALDDPTEATVPVADIAVTRPSLPRINVAERKVARVATPEDAPAPAVVEQAPPPSTSAEIPAPVAVSVTEAVTPVVAPVTIPPGAALSMSELCGASGAAPGLISSLEEYGLIAATTVAGVRSYDAEALEVARLASSFALVGLEPRHLVILKRAADRQAELYAQAVGPLLRQRNPASREEAQRRLDHLVEVGSALQGAFVRSSLERQFGQ